MGYFRCRTKMASKMRRMGSSSARFQEVQDNIFINRFFKRLQQKAKNEVFAHINRYWRGFILGRRGVFSLAHSLNLAVMSACLQWESYARSHSSNETNFMHMFFLCENSESACQSEFQLAINVGQLVSSKTIKQSIFLKQLRKKIYNSVHEKFSLQKSSH